MMDPASIKLYSSLASTCATTILNFIEFGNKLANVGPETRTFLNLIERVYKDLHVTADEFSSKVDILKEADANLVWIRDTIENTTAAYIAVGQLIGGNSADLDLNNTVSLTNRFKWVLSKKDKFTAEQGRLEACHRSLLGCYNTYMSHPASIGFVLHQHCLLLIEVAS